MLPIHSGVPMHDGMTQHVMCTMSSSWVSRNICGYIASLVQEEIRAPDWPYFSPLACVHNNK